MESEDGIVKVSLYQGSYDGSRRWWEELFSESVEYADLKERREINADELRGEGIFSVGLSNEGDDNWIRVRVDVVAEPGFQVTTTGLDPVESLVGRGDGGKQAREICYSVMLPRKSFGENWTAVDTFFNANTRVSIELIR